jgi:hypothetical protein
MLTDFEKQEFRIKLIRDGKKIKHWCKENGLDYNRFSQELNDHAPWQEKNLSAVKEYIVMQENGARNE